MAHDHCDAASIACFFLAHYTQSLIFNHNGQVEEHNAAITTGPSNTHVCPAPA
jgi:hypothetical protein